MMGMSIRTVTKTMPRFLGFLGERYLICGSLLDGVSQYGIQGVLLGLDLQSYPSNNGVVSRV